jgi:hypothetical protein
MSDLILLNGLDQSLPVKDDWILDKVDEIIRDSLEKKDVYYALNSCKALKQIAQLSGIALAKFFYLIKQNWDEYEIDEDFDEIAFDYVGVHKNTVSTYTRVWQMHEADVIPESVSENIRQRNIKDQIPIALALDQGYNIREDEWEELSNAPDYTTVAAKIREIKGKEPRKSALLIYISDDGTITATQEGRSEFVGYLNVDDAGDIAEKAILRLIKSAGVLEK